MSEKQWIWILVIGGLFFCTFVYLMNPWFLLSVPIAIIVPAMIDEHSSRKERIRELELKLKEADERTDFLRTELSESESCNKTLRRELQFQKKEIQKLTRDPAAEMKQIELNAEKEITRGA